MTCINPLASFILFPKKKESTRSKPLSIWTGSAINLHLFKERFRPCSLLAFKAPFNPREGSLSTPFTLVYSPAPRQGTLYHTHQTSSPNSKKPLFSKTDCKDSMYPHFTKTRINISKWMILSTAANPDLCKKENPVHICTP